MIIGHPRRYAVEVMGTVFSFCLAAPADRAARALSAAVAELRAVDAAFSPYRSDSMVTRVRRGELAPSAYPPRLTEVVDRCGAMNAATDGWFDAWGLPGGFDPSGLVKGWGTERAAARMLASGVDDFAISAGGDVLVRGSAPHGGPWRVGIRHPHDPAAVVLVLELTDAAVATSASYERGPHILAPHAGSTVATLASATAVGPDLATADAYATALYAAGTPGLGWFNGASDYCAFTLDDRLVATFSDSVPQNWLP
jgi:thiamine biosynthesis lipoprotein